MSLEISRRTRNEASSDPTLRSGEPMSERLSPADFHIYRAALETLGVPHETAQRKAAMLRLSQCRTSAVRREMLSEATNGNNHHNAITAAEHKLDSIAANAVKSSLQAINALHREPVAIPVVLDSGTLFEGNK